MDIERIQNRGFINSINFLKKKGMRAKIISVNGKI